MKTTQEALENGFTKTAEGAYSFYFGEDNQYELSFEPLIFDDQMYVALYKNQDLLTDKVVIKPGKL